MIWPLGGRIFWTAGAWQSNGQIWGSNSLGLSCSSLVGNPHWRIPNSSVRTNSSETRRSSSLTLKKLTELIWDFQWLHSKGLGRCRIWDEHHLEISFLSITSTPFNSTVFPMTQEGEKQNYENESLQASYSSHQYQVFTDTPISSLSKSSWKSSGIPKSSVEDIHF